MSAARSPVKEAGTFRARLIALPSEAARLRAGLTELEALFRDLVRAAVPPNPQFERERIIVQARCPRELVFLLGLLSEGENEAALLLELIDSIVAADPAEPVGHMLDEAWYYLRTSIDARWQLDEGKPSAAAAVAYLFVVLTERLDGLRSAAREAGALGFGEDPERAVLLRGLRDDFMSLP